MIFLKILVLAIALFVFLRSLAAFINVFTSNKNFRIVFLKVFPLVELLMWLSYAFWALNQLFNDISVYPLLTGGLIIVIVAIFGWYFLRDFISGIILKSENAFEPGQKIKTPLFSGTIRKLGYRSMEIITSEGESALIPFSLLTDRHITLPADNSKGAGQNIRLKVSSRYQPEKIQSMLEKRILEMPWIVLVDDIQVKIKREDNDNYTVEINLHSLNSKMAMKTEDSLQIFIREVFK